MTRVIVGYASKRGGTAEITEWIGEALRVSGLQVAVRPIGDIPMVSTYDAVILGGSLYAGRWHRDARRFVRRHAPWLQHMPVWLFASGPLDHSAGQTEIPPVPTMARAAQKIGALGAVTFGGRLSADAKGLIASKIAEDSGGDYRDRDAIRAWAIGVAAELASLGAAH
jgi:menaquinone-dependent protoporphyrinogen oxidase